MHLFVRRTTLSFSAFLIAVVACEDAPVAPEPSAPPPASIELSSEAVGLYPNESAAPQLLARDANGGTLAAPRATWTTSDASVATVDSAGRVTAIATGTATVTAHVAELQTSLRVRVTRWSQIVAGGTVRCALDSSDAAWCWGANNSLDVALGIDERRISAPMPLATPMTFESISAGSASACGTGVDGMGYCWGNGDEGAFGAGYDQLVGIALVGGGMRLTQVSVGVAYACGIDEKSEAYCWGWGWWGELGVGYPTEAWSPVAVIGGHRFKRIETGEYTCAITLDDETYCWGGATNNERELMEPRRVDSLPLDDLAVGRGWACGLHDALITCWGPFLDAEQPMGGDGSWSSIAASGDRLCAIAEDGGTYCGSFALDTGFRREGQYRDLERLPAAPGFVQISVGGSVGCGLTAGGAGYCWGEGDLGDGSADGSGAPIRVRPPTPGAS